MGAFLNFQERFPNSIEYNPESHSIWLCRRLQGVFMRDIEQWFLWQSQERGGGGRNVMKALGPTERGYGGLGNCGLFACVCFREINRSLKSWESKTEKYWYKEWQILRKRNLTCVGGFQGDFLNLFCVYMWHLTLSNSLDSFLFSSVSRTLSLSYFCLFSVSNSSRSLWLQRRESTGLWNFLYCINFDLHFNKYPLISHSASVKKAPSILPLFVCGPELHTSSKS